MSGSVCVCVCVFACASQGQYLFRKGHQHQADSHTSTQRDPQWELGEGGGSKGKEVEGTERISERRKTHTDRALMYTSTSLRVCISPFTLSSRSVAAALTQSSQRP
jgi:hypothetical protein